MIINCKMCGSEIHCEGKEKVVTCEFCGSKQSIPETSDTHEIELFNLANNYRIQNRYDQAIAIYKQIIEEFPNEIEGHWGLLLCEYGIEYVDDILTNSKIPTCHRTKDCSIFDDEEYKLIIEKAPTEKKIYYQEEAKKINDLQNEIKQNVNDTKYDIFICYKETDFDGNRTKDSQYASLFYSRLTQKGYKVFYAKESLKQVVGNYEPYIYSALRSAKVMLVLGTTKEFIQAPWVRNEWSRFLELTKLDLTKRILPMISFRNVNDLPDELRYFQVQDLTAIDFLEVLLRSMHSVFDQDIKDKPQISEEKPVVEVIKKPSLAKKEESKVNKKVAKPKVDKKASIEELLDLAKQYKETNNKDEYIKTLEKLADLGNKDSQEELIAFYSEKENLDYKLVYKFASLASKQGSGYAYHALSSMYLNGHFVKKDAKEAFNYAKLAADAGDVDSICELYSYYKRGIGVSKNLDLANKYLIEAADKGHKNALIILALHYYLGCEGLDQDYSLAFKYFKKGEEKNIPEAFYYLGDMYLEGEYIEVNVKKAIQYYEKASQLGYSESTYSLGYLYLKGWDVNKDLEKAYNYFNLASDQGSSEAKAQLGELYYNGIYVNTNYKKAFEYFNDALAIKPEVKAYYYLAHCYLEGNGCQEDTYEAIKNYELAVNKGDEAAAYELGLMYYNAKGVARDTPKGLKYLEIAAEEGYKDSEEIVGDCYYYGNGTVEDFEKAYKYYSGAAEKGSRYSEKMAKKARKYIR